MPIRSFASTAIREFFHTGTPPRHLPADVRRNALKKLTMVNAAQVLEDLRVPPGNNLEALKGNLAGYHSIRVNRKYRVIFRWSAGGADDVDVLDYHG